MIAVINLFLVADPWTNILHGIAEIKTPISVAALAVIALLIVLKYAGRVPSARLARLLNVALVVIAITGLVPMLASSYIDYQKTKRHGIYRVRVNIVGPTGQPSEDTKIWSTLDSVQKRLDGGAWELDVPVGANTSSGNLEIFARDNQTGDAGKATVTLAGDENLSVDLVLQPSTSVVRGTVTDEKGRGLAGVRVFAVGYSGEAVSTDNDGGFQVQSHVAAREQVKLHFEKSGHPAVEDYFPAGNKPVSVRMEAAR